MDCRQQCQAPVFRDRQLGNFHNNAYRARICSHSQVRSMANPCVCVIFGPQWSGGRNDPRAEKSRYRSTMNWEIFFLFLNSNIKMFVPIILEQKLALCGIRLMLNCLAGTIDTYAVVETGRQNAPPYGLFWTFYHCFELFSGWVIRDWTLLEVILL